MTTATCRRTTPAAPDWNRGACIGTDPESYFPAKSTPSSTRAAKAVCARCPIQRDCLDWAMTAGEGSGVWGGLSEVERRELVAQRTGLYSVSAPDVAEAEGLARDRGDDLLRWLRDEKLPLKVMARRLGRERERMGGSHLEPPTHAVLRLTFRFLGVVMEEPVSVRYPAQNRVIEQWPQVQRWLEQGVMQRTIAELLGVSKDSLRSAMQLMRAEEANAAQTAPVTVSGSVSASAQDMKVAA